MKRLLIALTVLGAVVAPAEADDDTLPSWNDSPAKRAILDFVSRTTTDGSPDFLAPGERIAVFDNDGTLWCEQPMYAQGSFAIDRVKALAPQHPEWQTHQPFAAILAGDRAALAKLDEPQLAALIAATHSGMTTDDFALTVRGWLNTARHPRFHRPFPQLVYQPMLELLAYLRAHGYKTFIASGGGIEFMRVFAEQAYGIPPEQVIGSSGKLKVELRDGRPVLVKLPELNSIDDKAGKPVNIELHLGRRPVMAFGNSDGDQAMLEWTVAGAGPRFALVVHHTDAAREYAYDRQAHVGKLDAALDEAATRGWTVVDMQRDWKTIFPKGPREESR
ncbi:MAG TPA: HAD family hydrolase [Pirellulales bacterium]|jgi:phosphoglycolate phosphatase-like HAD superfamily hydrolase|nr:HAD family hydrolase [Pirellulales bacterium]